MTRRVHYLSGPMTGYEQYNYPAFDRVAKHLRSLGYEIRSPHECEPETDSVSEEQLWENMMVKCMKMMEECSAIILMQGWPHSRGARRELEYAIRYDFQIFYYDEATDQVIRMSSI
jgi:nucleoside 2-deoxyribosyltransferase